MPSRSLISTAVLTVLIAAMFPAALTVAGQTKPYTPPRTPDGQPDLQGYWTNSMYTPLERPRGVTKEFYTPVGVHELSGMPPNRYIKPVESSEGVPQFGRMPALVPLPDSGLISAAEPRGESPSGGRKVSISFQIGEWPVC
jgi:hypothetical protein